MNAQSNTPDEHIETQGKVSGAHWNAIRQVAEEMGIEVEI